MERLLSEQVDEAITANLHFMAGGGNDLGHDVTVASKMLGWRKGIVNMKSRDWQNFLEEQRGNYGKVLYTLPELAAFGGHQAERAANVDLSMLHCQAAGYHKNYAHGLYGVPDEVELPALIVAAIDSYAYITGHYALYSPGLVTQSPFVITSFTDNRRPRAGWERHSTRSSSFCCVRSRVYHPVNAEAIASPAQAALRLCLPVAAARHCGGIVGHVSQS